MEGSAPFSGTAQYSTDRSFTPTRRIGVVAAVSAEPAGRGLANHSESDYTTGAGGGYFLDQRLSMPLSAATRHCPCCTTANVSRDRIGDRNRITVASFMGSVRTTVRDHLSHVVVKCFEGGSPRILPRRRATSFPLFTVPASPTGPCPAVRRNCVAHQYCK